MRKNLAKSQFNVTACFAKYKLSSSVLACIIQSSDSSSYKIILSSYEPLRLWADSALFCNKLVNSDALCEAYWILCMINLLFQYSGKWFINKS